MLLRLNKEDTYNWSKRLFGTPEQLFRVSARERGRLERFYWPGSAGSLKLTSDNTLRGRAYCCSDLRVSFRG